MLTSQFVGTTTQLTLRYVFVKSSLDGRWFNIICDYNWVMASLFIIIAYPAHLHSHSQVYRR